MDERGKGLLVSIALVAILAACGLAGCAASTIDPMEQQAKYKPYERNPFFADERAMRPIPAGTVPRERPLELVNLPAQDDGRYPIALTRDLLVEGRHQYDITCAACHGIVGDGDSLVARKMLLRQPPALFAPRLVDFTPRQLYDVVTDGYGLMPSYAAELTPRDRWAVVAYVRALQIAETARIGDAPPDVRAKLQSEAP